MSCGKEYIRFGNNIQVLFANKVGTEISPRDPKAPHVHPYLCVYDRISWENSADGKIQRKSQNNNRLFSQSWKIGRKYTGAMCQSRGDPQDLWRS